MATDNFSQGVHNYGVDYYTEEELDDIADAIYMALDGLGPDEGIDAIDDNVWLDMWAEWEDTGEVRQRSEDEWRAID